MNRITITGTPGTGKKTISKILSSKLKFELIDINKIAIENKIILKEEEESLIVDIKKLKKTIKNKLKNNIIIIGHLAPLILDNDDVDLVIILRCSPEELKRRYIKRGYKEKKIKDNISSEILDTYLIESLNTFDSEKLCEIDTSKKQSIECVNEIINTYNKDKEKQIGKIDWLGEIKTDKKLREYFN